MRHTTHANNTHAQYLPSYCKRSGWVMCQSCLSRDIIIFPVKSDNASPIHLRWHRRHRCVHAWHAWSKKGQVETCKCRFSGRTRAACLFPRICMFSQRYDHGGSGNMCETYFMHNIERVHCDDATPLYVAHARIVHKPIMGLSPDWAYYRLSHGYGTGPTECGSARTRLGSVAHRCAHAFNWMRKHCMPAGNLVSNNPFGITHTRTECRTPGHWASDERHRLSVTGIMFRCRRCTRFVFVLLFVFVFTHSETKHTATRRCCWWYTRETCTWSVLGTRRRNPTANARCAAAVNV